MTDTIYVDLQYIEDHVWIKVEEIQEEAPGEVYCFYNLCDANIVTTFNVEYDGDELLLEREKDGGIDVVKLIPSDDVPEMFLVVHHSQYMNLFKIINMEFLG